MGAGGVINMPKWKKRMLSDAHVHLDIRKEDAGRDFIEYLEKNKLQKIVLIINTREQMEVFQECREAWKLYLERIELVFGINKHDEFWEEGLRYCKENHKRFNLKIHPRLFSIAPEEAEWYVDSIGKINPHLTVVDDFFYGDSVQEDIGLQLICEIAKKYPQRCVIMAHAGGVNLLRHVIQTKVYKNIYYDISFTGNYLAASSIEQDIAWLLKYMSNRVLLGSDYPDFTIRDARRAMEKQAKKLRLADEKLLQITSKNTESVYGGDIFGKTD